ncbi:hypothetical protein GW17_00058940, partial [Ensete ventricosum]
NEEEGQQGMARPPTRGRPDAAKDPLQWGGRLRPPVEAAAARGHDWLRPARKGRRARKGWLPVASTQGPAARGQATRVVAPWQGSCRSQRAAAACAGQWQ